MQNLRVKRCGRPDLRFTGVRLAEVDERRLTTVREYWWEVSLYKTSMGGYVLASCRRSRAEGCRRVALSFSSAGSLLDFLDENSLSPWIAQDVLDQAMERDRELFEAGRGLYRQQMAC